MNKTVLITLLSWLLVNVAIGQNGTVYGIVKDATTGKPMPEVRIGAEGTSWETDSDENGRYRLEGLPAGNYKIIYFFYGFAPLEREVVVGKEDIQLDVKLENLMMDFDPLEISGSRSSTFGMARLNAVDGNAIYAGKKNEVVVPQDMGANLATNNSRQLFGKVAGLNIWESDGAGIQLGIGGRGLSPNRTSNFNTRQNGYDIAADALGYPESYYTPASEAVDRIEVVRGAASLQYGTQFGGMINFVMKKGPRDKPFELVSRQTVGSWNLLNSFNSVGGQKGKWNYYAFYQRKQGDGWRPNSGFSSTTTMRLCNFNLPNTWY